MKTLPLNIPVAILAGGLATRLRPITEKIPKSLVPVAGRPFLAHQLELLHSRGIRRAVLCVGYLGEMIQRDFGTGEKYGVKLDYSFDGEKLLGTGGAIKRALPLLGDEFFVLYGDSYLPVEYAPNAEIFRRSGKPGLMTVYRNEGKYDTSNVVFADGEIKVYDKKVRLPEMRHIDYGLSLFKAAVFDSHPAGREVRERFYEIGSHAGLAELETLLQSKSP
jgi:NDP-sugar pyrophosphorylase family protein